MVTSATACVTTCWPPSTAVWSWLSRLNRLVCRYEKFCRNVKVVFWGLPNKESNNQKYSLEFEVALHKFGTIISTVYAYLLLHLPRHS